MRASPLVLIIEPRKVIIHSARSPISLKHMFVPYGHFALVLLIKWHHLLIVVEFKKFGCQISTSGAPRWLAMILIWACSGYVFPKASQSCRFSL